MKYIYFILLSLFIISCDQGGLAYDHEIGVKDDFPESSFEVDFDYETLKDAILQEDGDVLWPTPQEELSFKSFSATSEVDNNNGIRFVKCDLSHDGYQLRDSISTNGNAVWVPNAEFSLKLNISETGDDIEGTPFMLNQLLNFLEIGKSYPTKDTIGGITISYATFKIDEDSGELLTENVGINKYGNIGESDYSIKIIAYEEYKDFDRDGVLNKKALRVTAEFNGLVGASSNPDLPIDEQINQWRIIEGRAVFLIDYQQ